MTTKLTVVVSASTKRNVQHERQFDSRRRTLACLARTLFPALPELANDAKRQHQETIADFYARSGDQFPEALEETWKLINERVHPEKKQVICGFLDLLNTRLGALLLCGFSALSWQYPFFLKFQEMSDACRENVLLSWSQSWLLPLRLVFTAFRTFTLGSLFAWVDDSGVNPFWSALGYPTPTPAGTNKIHSAARDAESTIEAALLDLNQLSGKGSTAQQVVEGLQGIGLSATAGGAAKDKVGGSSTSAEVCVDVVVLGSGAGGGVAAAVFAQAGLSVLVVEKGQFVAAENMTRKEIDALPLMFESGGLFSTEDAAIAVLAGNTLGGGTRVNWCASFKTPHHVRQEWAQQHGLHDFMSDRYETALEEVCQRQQVNTEVRHDGQNSVLTKGLSNLGVDCGVIPRNCTSVVCSGLCTLGCSSGHKQDGVNTFLADAVRKGAKILTNTRADYILVENQHSTAAARDRSGDCSSATTASSTPHHRPKRATGVMLSADHPTAGKIQLKVNARYIVSSCGSLHGPPLLQRSGISCNGNVGRHLHLHPATMVFGVFPQHPLAEGCAEGPIRMWEGVMMSAYSREVAGWQDNGYGALLATPQLVTNLFAAFMPWRGGGRYKQLLLQYPNVSSVLVYARDRGCGQVMNSDDGIPRVHYSLSKEDAASLQKGVELAVRALVAAGAHTVFTLHQNHDSQCSFKGPDDPSIEEYIRRLRRLGVAANGITLGSAHQMGSCRMGCDPSSSLVDGRGECWEVGGLYVADGSAFPGASGVNPMITVQALSHMVAHSIVDHATGESRKRSRRPVALQYDT